MSAMYDLYQPGHSWLHRLDARCKLLFTACGMVVLLQMGNLWVIIAALLATQAALWSARIRRERIAWAWRMLLPMLIMIPLLWVITYPGEGEALWAFWFIRITARNLAQGLVAALRLAALTFVFFIWLFSTDQATLVRSLVALGVPYTWGLTLAMALRYLPTMASIFRMISDAQQARALNLQQGGLLRRARAYTPIIVAMLITALRTAESLSRALESRALGAAAQRTYLRRLHFRRVDLLVAVGIVAASVALLWARYALGFGADPLRLLR